jgi:hypothetical protein
MFSALERQLAASAGSPFLGKDEKPHNAGLDSEQTSLQWMHVLYPAGIGSYPELPATPGAVHCGNSFDTGVAPYQSIRLNR